MAEENTMMQERWDKIKERCRDKWDKLSYEDLAACAGSEKKLMEIIGEKYCMDKQDLENSYKVWIDSFLH